MPPGNGSGCAASILRSISSTRLRLPSKKRYRPSVKVAVVSNTPPASIIAKRKRWNAGVSSRVSLSARSIMPTILALPRRRPGSSWEGSRDESKGSPNCSPRPPPGKKQSHCPPPQPNQYSTRRHSAPPRSADRAASAPFAASGLTIASHTAFVCVLRALLAQPLQLHPLVLRMTTWAAAPARSA